MSDYLSFLASKASVDPSTGIENDLPMPPALKDFQAAIVAWALRRGRAALFAGTGLGKTLMEITWAQHVAEDTGKPVLILAPLAVATQFEAEGRKFGIPVNRIAQAHELVAGPHVYVTNYDKLERFDLSGLSGIVLDESSILKAFDGKTRNLLIARTAHIPFRLAASATPAPNDYMELGNHAEFLGVMSYVEMLATFFTHDGGSTSKWRLKRHGEGDFWAWLASWSVMLDKPSSLGFSDDGYILPPLSMVEHRVGLADDPVAKTLTERLRARRTSMVDRVDLATILAVMHDRPCVVWCNLNDESDLLTREIPGAVQVRGSDSEGRKESALADFAAGRTRVLVTKPSICGFGMNWQHCHDTIFVGLNDSFEQLYQAVRRFWRFGQTNPVDGHLISAYSEGAVLENIRRKEADAARMMRAMVQAMAERSEVRGVGMTRSRALHNTNRFSIPAFLEA